MTARALLLAFASALVLAGPVVAQDPSPPVGDEDVRPAIPEIWSPAPVDDQGRSAYGLFLAGRLAAARGDAGEGAVYLRRALMLTPEQPAVRDQAFATNLLGGDLAFAARVTPEGEGVPALVTEAGRLVAVVGLLDAGEPRAALAQIDARPIGRPHQRAGRLLTPWLAASAGDWDRALAPVTGIGPDTTALFQRADRARLLESRRRHDEAEAEWLAVLRSSLGRRLFSLDYGAFLERRGRRAEAVAHYDAAVGQGVIDDRIAPARARAVGRGRPPASVDLRQGAADSLSAAALQASAEGQYESAAVYLRLAQDLSPSDLTLLNLGDALISAGLEGPGRDVLSDVTPADPATYAAAQLSIGQSLDRDGQTEAALDPLRAAAVAAPGSPVAAVTLAERLSDLGRHEEALAAVSDAAFAGAPLPPEALQARAIALRALGRQPEAEAALQGVLAVDPDNTEALSLLGALWLDAGRVQEGAALIARAAEASPDDADVQGALGWSQYRQGLFDQAVTTLEAVVDAQPADAVVNDHLGDAYWQVGRRREARFQWSRALTLMPGAALEASLRRKLEVGLPEPATGGT